MRTRSEHSNANSNHSKGFKAFKCKLEPFERVSKHLNAILTLKRDSNHSNATSNEIQSIQMLILTIGKGFEAFECKFKLFEWESKHSKANSSHSKEIQCIPMKFTPFEQNSKHSNHSKAIRHIRMQILTIRKSKQSNAKSNNSKGF